MKLLSTLYALVDVDPEKNEEDFLANPDGYPLIGKTQLDKQVLEEMLIKIQATSNPSARLVTYNRQGKIITK